MTHIRRILSHATKLERFGGLRNRRLLAPGGEGYSQRPLLDFRGLVTLAGAAGATLTEFLGQGILRANVPQSSDPLYVFTALRKLDWQSPTTIRFNPRDVPFRALAALEYLSFTSINDSFLSLLGMME